jgi:pimeloyl-ACP methyl ester carboxylesterase
VAGEGFPLVLLHALGENALDWIWVMTALPGISGTSGTLPDYSPRSFALFVEAFLDSVGLGRRISPALSILTLPGYREATVAFCKTPHGARQRARILAVLLFAHRDLARAAWHSEQYRLWSPAFVERPEHFTDVLAGFLAETVRP